MSLPKRSRARRRPFKINLHYSNEHHRSHRRSSLLRLHLSSSLLLLRSQRHSRRRRRSGTKRLASNTSRRRPEPYASRSRFKRWHTRVRFVEKKPSKPSKHVFLECIKPVPWDWSTTSLWCWHAVIQWNGMTMVRDGTSGMARIGIG